VSRPAAAFGLRLLLAGVFLWAAIGKIVRPSGGGALVDAVAPAGTAQHYGLVGGELLLAWWLMSGLWPRVSAVVAVAALAVFTGAIGSELARPDPRACGCGAVEVLPDGAVPDPAAVRRSLRLAVARNVVLILAGAAAAVLAAPPRRVPAPVSDPPDTPPPDVGPRQQVAPPAEADVTRG